MNIEEYMETVMCRIENKAFKNTVKTELLSHICDRTDYYTDCGLDSETAERKALEHMGNPQKIGEEMNRLYDYKKHKIISVICLVLFAVSFILFAASHAFYNPFSHTIYYYISISLQIITFIFQVMSSSIVYNFSFKSRSSMLIIIQSLFCFISAVLFFKYYYSISNAFSTLPDCTFTVDCYEPAINICAKVIAVYFFIFFVLGLTCASEIKGIINGTTDENIIERYSKFGKFTAVFSIITAIILTVVVTFSFINI